MIVTQVSILSRKGVGRKNKGIRFVRNRREVGKFKFLPSQQRGTVFLRFSIRQNARVRYVLRATRRNSPHL